MIRLFNPLLLQRGVSVVVRLSDGSRAGTYQWRGKPRFTMAPVHRYAGLESSRTRMPLFKERTVRESRWGKPAYRRWEPNEWPTFSAMRKALRPRNVD